MDGWWRRRMEEAVVTEYTSPVDGLVSSGIDEGEPQTDDWAAGGEEAAGWEGSILNGSPEEMQSVWRGRQGHRLLANESHDGLRIRCFLTSQSRETTALWTKSGVRVLAVGPHHGTNQEASEQAENHGRRIGVGKGVVRWPHPTQEQAPAAQAHGAPCNFHVQFPFDFADHCSRSLVGRVANALSRDGQLASLLTCRAMPERT
jgi:hypothetical protein